MIAAALIRNDTLIDLNLEHNRLGDAAARDFIDSLCSNYTLQQLSIYVCWKCPRHRTLRTGIAD
jgi:hypothetical protein